MKEGLNKWLLVVGLLTLAARPGEGEREKPRVVCYHTSWAAYRPGAASFTPQNINPHLCTHLIYAFGSFTEENTLVSLDKWQDIDNGGFVKFTGLKTDNPNLKTMFAIGGTNEGSSRLSSLATSAERRKELVLNAIKFLRENNFDGLDLDWQYPAFLDGGRPEDREHHARLVQELREGFDKESEASGKPRLLLTTTVPSRIEYIDKGYDIPKLNRYLDWINVLTYNYHTGIESTVDHHAPLYALEDSQLNIDFTIKHLLKAGADRNKLVLGIPVYGRTFTLSNPQSTGIGASAAGPGEEGEATRDRGSLAYFEICEKLTPKTRADGGDKGANGDWTVARPDPRAMGPFAYKGNQWVGYDDEVSAKKKAEYVAEQGLGGIMFWSIDKDDFQGKCHGKPYPLIEAAKEALYSSLGQEDGQRLKSTTVASPSNTKAI